MKTVSLRASDNFMNKYDKIGASINLVPVK